MQFNLFRTLGLDAVISFAQKAVSECVNWTVNCVKTAISIGDAILKLGDIVKEKIWIRWKGEGHSRKRRNQEESSFRKRGRSLETDYSTPSARTGSFRGRGSRFSSRNVIKYDLHDPFHTESNNTQQVKNETNYTEFINARSRSIILNRLAHRNDTLVNVLILMSDTGGGHRASAQALEAAFESLYPGRIIVKMVDILTDHTSWPMSRSVEVYQYAAKNPIVWRAMYETAKFPPTRWANDQLMSYQNFHRFTEALQLYNPDMIISVHPLCQNLPLKVLRAMGSSGRREIPFVTVITDLGGAHPTWFDKQADKVFLASEAVLKTACKGGIERHRIHHLGLPIRPAFWSKASPKSVLRAKLGLELDYPTVLVAGGGDGVGGLSSVASAIIERLGVESGAGMNCQIVVICGKNTTVKRQLESIKVCKGLAVKILAFVENMDEWMGAVDILVTKAGPGTIAEATIRGLPILLSGYLPGQEEGNIPFVTEGGFGAFSKNPPVIADTVAKWLRDPALLSEMSAAALRASRPSATYDIAREIGDMMFTS